MSTFLSEAPARAQTERESSLQAKYAETLRLRDSLVQQLRARS